MKTLNMNRSHHTILQCILLYGVLHSTYINSYIGLLINIILLTYVTYSKSKYKG